MSRLAAIRPALVDPSDPLLDLGEAAVPIAGDPVRLAFVLGAGGGLELDVEPARARALRHALDGERDLWLALGLLSYRSQVAPVALWPVMFASDGRLVHAVGRAPRVNDALVARLAADGVELSLADGAAFDLADVLARAAAVADANGWRVDRAARVVPLSFARFDVARDAAAVALISPPLTKLCGDAPADVLPRFTSDELLAPLDADASQLVAVAAAAEGACFVVQGAPGTGKSQTIANLVAHCASSGKSVLVVSDRPPALDVVFRRLAALGIGDFCLPLYGDHAAPERVIAALTRVLDRAFRPAAGPAGSARASELAAPLDAHRSAMHAQTPLGASVHDVVARLVELRTAPRAALAERDAALLERAGFERRLAAVRALAEAAHPVEPVASHVWRAAAPARADEHERVGRALASAADAVTALGITLAQLEALVPGCLARTTDQLRELGTLAELAAGSPRPGAELLTAARGSRTDDVAERVALIRARGGGAVEPPRDPMTFVAIALRQRALAAEVAASFVDPTALPAAELWAQLKRWTTSLGPVRYVALRSARAAVRAAARDGALETDAAMLTALEAALAEQACRAALVAADAPARRWLGELAADPLALDLDAIEAASAWANELRRAFDRAAIAGGEAGRQAAWRALVAQVAAGPERARLEPFADLAEAVTRWDRALDELAAATGIAADVLAGAGDHVPALAARIGELTRALTDFPAWARFHLTRQAARVDGVEAAIDAIERGDLPADQLADAWQRATLLSWLEAEVRATPALARFDGTAHHARVSAFAEADRAALAAARTRAVAKLAERVPAPRTLADHSEVIALRGARADRPLRQLFAQLPTFLARLAPCVLATPHAVARELDSSLPMFDVVVFDEASRLPLTQALGALARGRSAIVVGDPRQSAPADGEPGLLAAALAADWPTVELTSHYRSRHDDVFAFANRAFYGDRVELLPAAARGPGLGVAWRQVAGTADGSGANRVEAEAVVAELASALRARPERTLGIVVAARAQAELVHEVLDAACRADSALAAGLAAHAERGEPLLVGTPDRLLGDERDVALLSIGGTADELGAFAQAGASRWLAVATTRARQQLIVFSSFAPDDIAADASPSARDVAALVAFARDAAAPRDNACEQPASATTAAIARALSDRGWIVRQQIGSGSTRVELAVVDPENPERFVLAIEHDGGTYARAARARDRDRVRAERLVELGWRVHRVWALDWWLAPEREIQRAHGAIVAALAASRRGASGPVARQRATFARGSAPLPVAAVSPLASPALATGSGPTDALADLATTPTRLARGAIAIGTYVAAAIPAGRRAPDDMFAARHHAELGKVVEQVLAAEAPIHVDLLTRRVGAYFGIGRVTQEVAEQVRGALDGRGRWGDEQGIVWRLDQDPMTVPSVRVAGASATAKRDIAEVPLSELAAAARAVVERGHGVPACDLVRDCARLLGFARLTERVSERVAAGIRLATARELIAIENERARLPT